MIWKSKAIPPSLRGGIRNLILSYFLVGTLILPQAMAKDSLIDSVGDIALFVLIYTIVFMGISTLVIAYTKLDQILDRWKKIAKLILL